MMSTSKGLENDLSKTLDDFAALQQEHLRGLTTVPGRRIHLWLKSRQKAFARLRSLLERLEGGAEAVGDAEFRTSFLQCLQEVLATEAELRGCASRRLDKIGQQLQTIRKGKKALQGYHLKDSEASPRIWSSRT